MKRKWIGIELGNHCHTHCIPRLQKVCDGTDQGGISEAQNWEGGGGFKYYYLAPSLLKQDSRGNWIISKEYNATQLAAAMAKHEGFRFQPGPVFCHVLLLDELNRIGPKTQSSLLEVMVEGQVTLDRTTYKLPDPFFVIATQNPMDHSGTFPLPESQMDRFACVLHLGYPDAKAERLVLSGQAGATRLDTLVPAMDLPASLRIASVIFPGLIDAHVHIASGNGDLARYRELLSRLLKGELPDARRTEVRPTFVAAAG